MITLFQHQQQALDQTEGHNRCAYYLDMGLGKTFVGSEKMMKLNTRINLVVCQCSKVQDWVEHFQDHYTRNCVFDLTNPKTFKWFFEQVQCEVPTLMIGVINNELTFRRKILKTLSGFTLMLDESSLIQNETAKRSKFILELNPENVILLSGTPTGGKYEKLWSQCRLLGWNISKELFWKQYIETEWVEDDGFWRKRITGYKNVDRLKNKLAEHGAVFMTTDDAGIDLPEKNMIQVKTRPSPLYWQFWRERVVSINSETLQKFELDSDFWGSNESYERELIGDTSLTRRLYARQLCGLYNPYRHEAFRDLVNSTEDRLIVFYNFTEEMERMKRIVQGMNRPVSILSGEVKDLGAYNFHSNSVTFIQYQAGAMGGNFQKANKIIYFSLPESWELWEQSQKRIHRMGQERPCFYYLLICPGTVEEDITMNCSEDMKRQRYKAKKSQWFRRMFTVALLMGVLIGFLMVKIPVWLAAPEPETKAVLFGTYTGQALKVQNDGTIVQAGDFTPLDVPMDENLQEYTYWMADAYDIDFAFLMGLIRNESNFQVDVISGTNDYGLMQINQKNHEWLSNAVGVTDFLDPYQNIQAGLYILGSLFEKYDDPHMVLMAYNMGEGGASKLWDQGIYQSKYSNRVLEYQETYIKELNEHDQM